MKHSTFLNIARLIASESKCVSWQVGAVIVKDDRIISTGYNGTRSGAENCCDHSLKQGWMYTRPNGCSILRQEFRENHSIWSKKNEIHAELNAILFAAKNGHSIDGATMYVTASPCPDCAKAITQSGIKKLFYVTLYDKNEDDWASIMTDAGIEVIQYKGKLIVA